MKVSQVNFNAYNCAQNVNQRNKKVNFKAISADSHALNSMPVEVLRDYAQYGKVLNNSKYVDAKVDYSIQDECSSVASVMFKPEVKDDINLIFEKGKNTYEGFSEIPEDWAKNIQLGYDYLIYNWMSGTRKAMAFRDGVLQYAKKTIEPENTPRQKNGGIRFSGDIEVPNNSVANFIKEDLPKKVEELEKRYKDLKMEHYIPTMKTLMIASELEKFMPEILKEAKRADNEKNAVANERQALLEACMNGNFDEIKTPEETTSATSAATGNTENKDDNEGKITFKDIGGQDKAIEVMKKSILFPLRYPNAFKNNSMKHGFILCGPPGTGKSLMAEALANESKAHFIKINASELDNKFVGETEAAWRNLFEEARANQPAIIFLDEFDAIAKKRGGQDEYGAKALNQILALLSDVEKKKDNIYFIGATNRPDILDSAITRSGRFGTHIEMKAPDTIEDVQSILDIHTRTQVLDDKVDKPEICKKLLEIKASGADIASISYTAGENAKTRMHIYEKMEDGTFKDSDMDDVKITQEDLMKAIESMQSQKDIKNNSYQ